MLDIIIDAQGFERRNGSMTVPDGFVSAYAEYSSAIVPYDDSDIRKLLQNPNRVPSRVTFGSRWVLNQRSHGSCNGHLCANLLARARWLRGIQDGLLFSGAYPYSKMNGGVDQGSVLEHGMRVICEQGCAPADLVTWDMIYPKLQPRGADLAAAKHRGFNPLRTSDLQQVRTALAQQVPVGIAVHAGSRFSKVDSKGRVSGVDAGRGNHAVVADDLVIIDGTEYLDIANSWGLTYGVEGRCYAPMDTILQPMASHVFYILTSTIEA